MRSAMHHAMSYSGRLIGLQPSKPEGNLLQCLLLRCGDERLRADEFSRLISHLQLSVAFSYPISQDIEEGMLFALFFDKQSELQGGRSAVDCENGSRLHRSSPEGPESLQSGNFRFRLGRKNRICSLTALLLKASN